jgi:hypothetical protein
VLHNLYDDKRQGYWCLVIADSRGDRKKLWWTFSSTVGSHSRSHSTAASVFTAVLLSAAVAAVGSDTEAGKRPDISATAAQELSVCDPATPSEVKILIG